jgi:ATP-dependent RNA helicase RhlE
MDSDVAARGIDVSEISHVINFDIPNSVDAYTHRIGRTGRAHRSGEAYTFAGQEDEQMMRGIERLVGTPIERRRLPNFNYGGFVPESQFEKGHSNPPGKKPSRHKRYRFQGKGNGNGSSYRSKRR